MAGPLPRVDSRRDVLDSVWPRRNLLRMDAVLCWQGEAHPDVLAVFECLVCMASSGDAVTAEMTKQRQKYILDELILAPAVEVSGQRCPGLERFTYPSPGTMSRRLPSEGCSSCSYVHELGSRSGRHRLNCAT